MKHSASVEASPQAYLIIAEQRLALNSGDATEIKLLSRAIGNPSPDPK